MIIIRCSSKKSARRLRKTYEVDGIWEFGKKFRKHHTCVPADDYWLVICKRKETKIERVGRVRR